jgi:hypothetical protein
MSCKTGYLYANYGNWWIYVYFRDTEQTNNKSPLGQVRTQNFSFGWGGGGADPEAIYNLCSILEFPL